MERRGSHSKSIHSDDAVHEGHAAVGFSPLCLFAYGTKRRMRGSWTERAEGEKEVCFVWSTFCIISWRCPCFAPHKGAMRSVPRSSPPAHMHHPSLSLPLPLLPPPAYSSHGVKGTTSRAISGSRTPTVQTLGVIKRRREIEIGNRGRRGGLVSCRNTEGIKNEAALLFLLFFSLFFWSELCLSLHLALWIFFSFSAPSWRSSSSFQPNLSLCLRKCKRKTVTCHIAGLGTCNYML